MASTNLACSVEQGFNFQKDAQIPVGYITSLKIGDREYKKDLAVTVPTDISGDKVKVVGVISHIFWEGGHADPIIFDCRISTGNKESSAVLQHTSMNDTSVSFSFVVYDYDPQEKTFYPNFHTNEIDLRGLISKVGGELEFGVDLDRADEVTSPKNFSFFLGVMPTEEKQEAHFAVTTSAKFVKKWGVVVAE
ncbi:hypothetical protein L1285_19240 [Pseudoalteromonas sp. DL2-H2.2]|uniref:hypothetical protein n=1 Tax=Pseudoalteromonas sp. DL2-H2.2 TaxID=2908889 RepID=UPI001F24BB38|nr:hypothetical protein [Pseudoalteromonas sp. DL2-H2.2]MCF2910449.1 hypothetical protein [Pseudoalteromonas sp. DL2-H2.2]